MEQILVFILKNNKIIYKVLSCNNNLLWDNIEENLNKDWNWKYISRLDCITWEVEKLRNPNIGDFSEPSLE